MNKYFYRNIVPIFANYIFNSATFKKWTSKLYIALIPESESKRLVMNYSVPRDVVRNRRIPYYWIASSLVKCFQHLKNTV